MLHCSGRSFDTTGVTPTARCLEWWLLRHYRISCLKDRSKIVRSSENQYKSGFSSGRLFQNRCQVGVSKGCHWRTKPGWTAPSVISCRAFFVQEIFSLLSLDLVDIFPEIFNIIYCLYCKASVTAWTPYTISLFFHRTSIPQERRLRPIHDIMNQIYLNEGTELESGSHASSTNHRFTFGHLFSSCPCYALGLTYAISAGVIAILSILIRVAVRSSKPTSALMSSCWPLWSEVSLFLLIQPLGNWESFYRSLMFHALNGLADWHHPSVRSCHLHLLIEQSTSWGSALHDFFNRDQLLPCWPISICLLIRLRLINTMMLSKTNWKILVVLRPFLGKWDGRNDARLIKELMVS